MLDLNSAEIQSNETDKYGPVQRIDFLVKAVSQPGITRSELAVLIVLANYTNSKTGLSWPAYETFANSGGMSKQAAIRAIHKLEGYGFITRQRRKKDHTNLSNVYQLNI